MQNAHKKGHNLERKTEKRTEIDEGAVEQARKVREMNLHTP